MDSWRYEYEKSKLTKNFVFDMSQHPFWFWFTKKYLAVGDWSSECYLFYTL